MVGSLVAGYQLANGLAIAWNKPLIGVNHMLGHLLVVRMNQTHKIQFPFVSLLVSGGHTMVVLSHSLLEHQILVDTVDIAAGDALDKVGRELGIVGNMIGKESEMFLQQHKQHWNHPAPIILTEPMLNASTRINSLAYSFASFNSQIKKTIEKYHNNVSPSDTPTRVSLLYQYQTTIFQHLIRKLKLALQVTPNLPPNINTLVCSGGVASNQILQSMLKEQLADQFDNFCFPDLHLCTDNATMIGWAGIELYEAGLTTEIGSSVVRKWGIDHLLDLEGWKKA